MLQDEIEQFKSKSFSTQKEMIAKTKKIETRAFKAMWTLEGENANEMFEKNKQMNASRAKKATYNAIGNRVKEVKKRLADSDVGSIYNAVELVVAPELIDWDA